MDSQGCLERHVEGFAIRGPHGERDRRSAAPECLHHQPSVVRPFSFDVLGAAGQSLACRSSNLEGEQRRRYESRNQDHCQDRCINVALDDPLAQTDTGEDQADLTARNHSEANEESVRGCSGGTNSGHDFANNTNSNQRRRHTDHGRFHELLDVGINADLQKEHRDKQVSYGLQFPLDTRRNGAPAKRQTSDESAHDGGQFRHGGQLGDSEREGQSQSHERAARTRQSINLRKNLRNQQRPKHGGNHQEPKRRPDDADQSDEGKRAIAGGDAHNDGQNDQPDHIVGHGRAQNRAGLDRGQGTEVTEDASSNADRGGGQGRTNEKRLVRGEAEEVPGNDSPNHGKSNTDNRHGHGRTPDRAKFAKVHLHAHFKEQENHADLAERGQHLTRRRPRSQFDQTKDRGPN